MSRGYAARADLGHKLRYKSDKVAGVCCRDGKTAHGPVIFRDIGKFVDAAAKDVVVGSAGVVDPSTVKP